MAVIETVLIPSTYARSNTNYVTVSNPSNMYKSTDSTATTYATCTSTRAATTSYYVYIKGFNLSSIPDDATNIVFSVRIKGYETGLDTGTSYSPALVNGTSVIANTTASTNFGTATKTIMVPTGALTWSQIKGYGSSNFGIMVTIRRAASNTQGYLYIYGADIVVNYEVPTTALPIRVKDNGTWKTPTKLLVKQSGSWVEASNIKVKNGGSWT